jgi:hypothetical protein
MQQLPPPKTVPVVLKEQPKPSLLNYKYCHLLLLVPLSRDFYLMVVAPDFRSKASVGYINTGTPLCRFVFPRCNIMYMVGGHVCCMGAESLQLV